MIYSLVSISMISVIIFLSGCVPSVGNYSEFSSYKIKQAQRTADGQVAFADGVYQGDLRGGKPHGDGRLEFIDGRVYQGGFSHGDLYGQGEMKFPDGRVMSGIFANGAVTRADIYYADGRLYRGAVKNGHAHGLGILEDPAKGTIEGNFFNGKASGTALLIDKVGNPAFAGEFRAGLPQGEGVCVIAGVASVCSKEAGKDVTQRELLRRAELSAKASVEQEAKAKLAVVHKDLAAKITTAARSAELSREAKQRWARPPDGDPCYCAVIGCLMVGSDDESYEQHQRSMLKWERKKLECREQYADFLGNKGRSDYASRLAELNQKAESTERHLAELRTQQRQREAVIETARKQTLADKAHMRKLSDEARAREEGARKSKLDADRQRCLSGGAKAASCHCRAVMGQPIKPKPIGAPARVCEA